MYRVIQNYGENYLKAWCPWGEKISKKVHKNKKGFLFNLEKNSLFDFYLIFF